MGRHARTVGHLSGVPPAGAHLLPLWADLLARGAARLGSGLVPVARWLALPELHTRLRGADRAPGPPADRRARAAPLDARRRARRLDRVRVLRRHPPRDGAAARRHAAAAITPARSNADQPRASRHAPGALRALPCALSRAPALATSIVARRAPSPSLRSETYNCTLRCERLRYAAMDARLTAFQRALRGSAFGADARPGAGRWAPGGRR